MVIHDIRIYHYDDYVLSDIQFPRRINEGACCIEWHRKGIQFLHGLKGTLHLEKDDFADICVEPEKIVSWNSLLKYDGNREWFQFVQEDGTIPYKLMVIKREAEKWMELSISVPNNINSEVMWKIAEIYEEQWSFKTPTHEIIRICDEVLPQYLPMGIDDQVRDIILGTWRQRKEERIVQDLRSSENLEESRQRIIDAVDCFKYLMIDEM